MKKYLPFVLLTCLGIVFIITRLYNILALPIFTDEAIYLRWSQIALFDASWRFISLTDGKQPSFVWLTMTMMRLVQDPLLAGRLVSVGAGFLSMMGLFLLGKELFKNKWIGITSSFLYLIFPMALVYDKMALYESLLSAFIVWSLYLEVLLIRTLRLDVALILGMVMGGGVLTKTSAFFSIYLLPSMLLLFTFGKNWRVKFAKWLLLVLLSVAATYAYYSILRLSPFFHIINEKNAIFVYPFKEWFSHPFEFFRGNFLGQWDWFINYVTWPIIALMVGSLFIYREFTKEKLLLFIWFAAPFVALALFGRVLYPRFIFFMILPLLPLAALSIVKLGELIKRPSLRVACYLLLLALPLRSDFLILTDFSKAPIPYSDLEQYIFSWSAGSGIKEAVDFFKEKAKDQKIYVATQGSFGLMPFSLEIYLVNHPNITLTGFWPIGETLPGEVMKQSEKIKTFLVFYQPCPPCPHIGVAPPSLPLRLISQYARGNNWGYLSIYEVKP